MVKFQEINEITVILENAKILVFQLINQRNHERIIWLIFGGIFGS